MLFYETSEEKLHSNDAWSKRMNALDSVKQTEIAKSITEENRGKIKENTTYKEDDVVVYGSQGICRITGTEKCASAVKAPYTLY